MSSGRPSGHGQGEPPRHKWQGEEPPDNLLRQGGVTGALGILHHKHGNPFSATAPDVRKPPERGSPSVRQHLRAVGLNPETGLSSSPPPWVKRRSKASSVHSDSSPERNGGNFHLVGGDDFSSMSSFDGESSGSEDGHSGSDNSSSRSRSAPSSGSRSPLSPRRHFIPIPGGSDLSPQPLRRALRPRQRSSSSSRSISSRSASSASSSEGHSRTYPPYIPPHARREKLTHHDMLHAPRRPPRTASREGLKGSGRARSSSSSGKEGWDTSNSEYDRFDSGDDRPSALQQRRLREEEDERGRQRRRS